ncbi:dienelactone hydrolase [Synechococcus sp. CS-1328]|uniref:alpha/beta hydrolase family protein n=1 Tax=Synechococcus sp. CS-1328 TaxID=2847976 RepID=UPI00223A905F|nr:dienelactone hydrolase [Synechococcus sp. CS-1328]MCT0226132.1 dienelactone hydrolase [Synechococcus sp. CS-1328]
MPLLRPIPLFALGLMLAPPAKALELIEIRLPLVDTSVSVRVAELRDPQSLLTGTSDLAQLNQATDGKFGSRLISLLQAPLPIPVGAIAKESAGSPLMRQVLLILEALVRVDGLETPADPEQIVATLERRSAKGHLSLLDVLEVLPGRSASIELDQAVFGLDRLVRQQEPAESLISSGKPAGIDPALSLPGPLKPIRQQVAIPVSHRPEPVQVITMAPSSSGNGRLVVISHGLWDDPVNFEGWGAHLASHGYTVLLPRHPGSDQAQQQAMLAGRVPPPNPDDLRLRPLDVSAAIDAGDAGSLALPAPVRTDQVVAMGQSWGATTVLQLAGARPSATQLGRSCENLRDPARNLSWVLQCSFLTSANRAGGADPRVTAVVAVSPPMRLLFDVGAGKAMNGRVLLVSGSKDWVVPAGPEAITPMAQEARNTGGGHRLVLAQGGDHFNLRSIEADGGGPLRGLLLAWTEGAFAAGPAAAPGPSAPPLLPADGWGDTSFALVDVTPQLPAVPAP